MRTFLIRSMLGLALGLMTGPSAQAGLYTSGHADLGIGLDGLGFDIHIHVEGGVVDGITYDDQEFEAGNVSILVPASTLVTGAPLDDPGLSDFRNIPESLGLAQGDAFFNLFQDFADASATNSPYLGLGAEDIALGMLVGNKINSIKLTGFSGPGQFTAWTPSRIIFDTFDGLGTDDEILNFGVGPGAHAHYHYAFSAPGTYEVTLAVSGVLVDGNTPISTEGTYTFVVVPEVPAPVMLGLVGGVVSLWGARRRFFTRRSNSSTRD